MKKVKFTTLILTLIIYNFNTSILYSQEQQAVEVKSLKGVVERKLAKIKNRGIASLVGDEIRIIENYLSEAQALIDDANYEKAFYLITIALSYFNLIHAKEGLDRAEKDLGKIKNKK